MCLFVYLAADAPLSEIPWNPASPAFHVSSLSESEAGVRQHFSLPNVYSVGSKEGCGCDFAQAPDDELLDDEDRADGVKARQDLEAYLVGQRQQGRARYELYSRWVGQHVLPPEATPAGRVTEIHDRPDWFQEGTFVEVTP